MHELQTQEMDNIYKSFDNIDHANIIRDASNKLLAAIRIQNPEVNIDNIERAIKFAIIAHEGQKRASGDPYVLHCIIVAYNVLEIYCEENTIIAAILHDVIEDTKYTYNDIRDKFGEDVAKLVDGMTKLTAMSDKSKRSTQYQEIQRIFFSISQNIRILFIKLADRLHNISTLEFIKSQEKRRRIAQETINIYAILASKLGLDSICMKLEDLSFKHLEPTAYESIKKRIQFLKEKDRENMESARRTMQQLLEDANIDAKISYREKTPYSIWQKIQKKTSEIERLSDIFGFRILCDNIDICYRILGTLHQNYPALSDRFKDYISLSKPNGYQSLHTALKNVIPSNIVEIQIRTYAMDKVAKKGLAAHWIYKGNSTKSQVDLDQIKKIHELLDNSNDASEFFEHSKLEMYEDCVFCFSPRGKIVTLPRGATPIDFAFAIHTQIGLACSGCKINDQLAPLYTELKNGDQVEILTSEAPQISSELLNFVVTAKARSTIKKYLHRHSEEQYTIAGQQIIQDLFWKNGLEYDEIELIPIMKHLKKDSINALLFAVGSGVIPSNAIKEHLHFRYKTNIFAKILQKLKLRNKIDRSFSQKSHPILESNVVMKEMVFHRCKRCWPLPGEEIVGQVQECVGLIIHTKQCESIQELHRPHVLEIHWDLEDKSIYNALIDLTLMNKAGSLSLATTIIARYDVNIHDIIIKSQSIDFFEIQIEVEIRNVQQLDTVMWDLSRLDNIYKVSRGAKSYIRHL